MTYDTAELKRLLAEATEGPIQKMADDPLAVDFHSAVYVPKMTGATPVTRLRSNAALIVAAVNALPALLARVEELERENEILKRLAPEHFRWTGGHDQTEDPEWIVDRINYGGAAFEAPGTPDVRLAVYDDQDRCWVAKPGDYIVKGENGLWVLPARKGGA